MSNKYMFEWAQPNVAGDMSTDVGMPTGSVLLVWSLPLGAVFSVNAKPIICRWLHYLANEVRGMWSPPPRVERWLSSRGEDEWVIDDYQEVANEASDYLSEEMARFVTIRNDDPAWLAFPAAARRASTMTGGAIWACNHGSSPAHTKHMAESAAEALSIAAASSPPDLYAGTRAFWSDPYLYQDQMDRFMEELTRIAIDHFESNYRTR